MQADFEVGDYVIGRHVDVSMLRGIVRSITGQGRQRRYNVSFARYGMFEAKFGDLWINPDRDADIVDELDNHDEINSQSDSDDPYGSGRDDDGTDSSPGSLQPQQLSDE